MAAPAVSGRRRGEEASADLAERWKGEVARAFAVLDAAHARSSLPRGPRTCASSMRWLRRAAFGSS
jgi:hypothetical protein